MKFKKFFVLTIFLLLKLALFSFAGEDRNNYTVKVPEFTELPKIDGLLENPIWEKGAVLDIKYTIL